MLENYLLGTESTQNIIHSAEVCKYGEQNPNTLHKSTLMLCMNIFWPQSHCPEIGTIENTISIWLVLTWL